MAPLLALWLLIYPARAGELEELNPDLSSQVFLKILAYDRSLQTRSGGKLVLAILYRPEREESERSRAVLQAAFQERANKGSIQGMSLSVTAVAFEARSLIKRLQGAGATLLYVTAGLEDQAAVISAAAQALRAPTLAGHRSLLEAGMAIAVVTKEDRPAIVINLPVAKALGMDLDPTLLRLSEVRR
jgi:hypothetical protein